ncbi:cyclase family protein [Altererythrobacter sp. MF3-039]|uniref:cyclase family protein n=1 Tax=Altererythrobacter sp. MF3-039 TaxID=3252901 RepID=UPI00390C6EF3
MRIAIPLAAALSLFACSQAEPPGDPLAGTWVDLTHTLDENAVFWPTADDYSHEEVMHAHTEGGWFYSSYNIHLSEHGGTHLDAPVHFAEGRQTTDQIPLDRLIGPAAVIDVAEASAADRNYRFTREDVLRWEGENGPLPDGAIVLFRTGFDQYWPDREAYMGTALRGEEGVAQLHFPGLSEGVAKLLAEERNIAAVGLDTPSLDYGQSKDFIAHRILLDKNIPGFENVANLSELPAKGAHVIALPTKIGNGSGGPLRIIALVPEG